MWSLRSGGRALAGGVAAFFWIFFSTPRAAGELTYSAIDAATVRVFSYKGVSASRIRSAAGNNYMLAAPDAGHGSGLLVTRDGLILTARHVVDDARIIAVQFPGEDTPVPARVAYLDKEHDHAFLVVEGTRTTHSAITEAAGKLAVRQTVYVVGYPLDASRKNPQSQQGIVSGVLPDGSLQLGIALNPGNSGGPVVDDKERLLGIAVARADPEAGAQGIGVAVPVEQILPSYKKVLSAPETASARKGLAAERTRLSADARLIAALLAADDSDATWRALKGDKNADPTGATLKERVAATLAAKPGPTVDELVLAAAERWNAAVVLLDRKQPAEEPLRLAREYAKRAEALDSTSRQRSTFLAFVLDGHGPTVGRAAAGSEGEQDGAASDQSSLDTLLSSLETDKNLPMFRIGPTLGFTAPFQLFGFGVSLKMLFGRVLSVDARYQFGWHAADSELTKSHLAEGLLGVPLGIWNGTTTARLVVDVEHNFSQTVFHYVPGEIPTVHALVLEAGVLTGPINLRLATPDPAATFTGAPEVRQVYVIEAGLRYTYFYRASSPYLASTARSMVELSGHVMAPPLGIPDDRNNADGEPLHRGLPGGKVEVGWGSAPFSWGLTEIGLGYFPSAGWIYFRLGWTYLFY